jgi:Nicotinamide mononucleotide transporter
MHMARPALDVGLMDLISIGLQLASSITTVWAMWLMGNKNPWGPPLAIASEAVWLVLITYAHLWGILPLTFVLIVIQVRNTIKWNSEKETSGQPTVL